MGLVVPHESPAARVDAERMLIATRSALEADGALLSPEERREIDALAATLQHTAEGSHDAAVIEAAVQALAKGTEAFAAERMNRSIRQALTGRSVEEV